MNLKTSLGINSSGDSDSSIENDKEKEEKDVKQDNCTEKTKLKSSKREQNEEDNKTAAKKTRKSIISNQEDKKIEKENLGNLEKKVDNTETRKTKSSNKKQTSAKRKKESHDNSDKINSKKQAIDNKPKRESTRIAANKGDEDRKIKRNKLKTQLSEDENSDSENSEKEISDKHLSSKKKLLKNVKNNDDIESSENPNDEPSYNKLEEPITQPLQVDDEVEMVEEENGSQNIDNFTLELQGSDEDSINKEAIKSNENEEVKSVITVELKGDEEKSSLKEDKNNSDNDIEKKNKFVGLSSSSEEESDTTEDKQIKSNTESKESEKKTNSKSRSSSSIQRRAAILLSSDDEDDFKEKSTKSEDKDEDFEASPTVLSSDDDCSGSEIIVKSKRKKKGSSESDASLSSNESKKKKKKRRRIKCADDSSESGSSGDESKVKNKSNQGESPGKGGRKNIKKIKKTDDLEEATKEAAEEEKERRRRIEERQKLFNQVFEIKESAKLEKLVLDFDPETKEELISVHKDLVAKMKPHQAKGVKFMWDCCFESLAQLKKKKGTGCILAHCMGLGKTFQVISLVHTLLTHPETQVNTVMVVCPLSTVLNWVNEFGKWLEDVEGGDDIEVFHLTKFIKNPDRACELKRWQHNGGVLVIGYEMFRNLTNESTKKFKAKLKKDFQETLVDPGADLIVCDEGHMLKNEATALSKAMTKIKTLRRIVLTGTPMQNNLKEYHCMVQFVKPNLLGTTREFLNRFVNPINNGQFVDSTEHDVKLMKRRAHVLHKMLEGLVQRFDYNVLTPFLPPKQEYVISVCLSELQVKLYTHYLENFSQKADNTKGGTRLFQDWQALGRIWTHPRVLKMSTDKANWLRDKKALEQSDSEGSLRDFIDDDDEEDETTPEESSDEAASDDSSKKKKPTHKVSTRRTRSNAKSATLLESSEEEKEEEAGEGLEDTKDKGEWWSEFIEPHHMDDITQSGKLVLLFTILKECELIEDKILVFSQSLFSLDLIEYFLDKIDSATQEGKFDEKLGNHQGTWCKGLDYFRLDGSTSSENRNIWCKAFNRENNPRARLFLISTRAGGLGINLTAANRVIIFDASWNPSHDIQSIFRVYRFGQKKPCYVYRFVAHGTMEEKVYERQVAKQSISNRVVDEQQVHRHFSMSDLNELYTFTPATKLEDRPTPALPKDPLMAEILSQMREWIEKYHEHDSLLENVTEEELNEEERKAAWEDYENDKKRGLMPPSGPQGPSPNYSANTAWTMQIELMRQQMKATFPNKSDEEINQELILRVSQLMRQQQIQMAAAQLQAQGNMGYGTQMYNSNVMFNPQTRQYVPTQYVQQKPTVRNILPKPSKQDEYNQQVYRMQQQANLARFQLQRMQAAQTQGNKSHLQSLLQGQLSQQPRSAYNFQTQAQPRANYPTANINLAELERMKQSYQASRANKSGVTITEIKESSGSSDPKT